MSSPLVTPALLTALARFDLSGHDEQSIREQWIYPLLGALGYGVGTMNWVDIPVKLELRPPMRALGHARFEIDYRPTVLGVGLWIIEAKRADSDVSDARHLGQARTYATDPRIDVPLIVLANGTRLRVHDLTAVEWDRPVVDIAQSELAVRFTELEAVLGARRVADFVRRRQLRHLRTALSAQVDERALEETLADVRGIVDETRALVIQNRDRIYYAARDELEAKRAADAKAIGVWGIAFAANSPYMIPTGEIWTCASMIRTSPARDRRRLFADLTLAAGVGDTTRMMFSLWLLRLGVALPLVDDEECGADARAIAERSARDAAQGFPDSPLDAAAHEFEMALVPFVARASLVIGTDAVITRAAEMRTRLDPVEWVRREASGDVRPESMIGQRIELVVRQIWTQQEPWTAESLLGQAKRLRALFAVMPARHDLDPGQIGNRHFETYAEADPLRPGARNVITEVAENRYAVPDDPISDSAQKYAQDLLARFFADSD